MLNPNPCNFEKRMELDFLHVKNWMDISYFKKHLGVLGRLRIPDAEYGTLLVFAHGSRLGSLQGAHAIRGPRGGAGHHRLRVRRGPVTALEEPRRPTINADWDSHNYVMCFVALLYATFRRFPCGFEGSKRKMADQKASDGRVGHFGMQIFAWIDEAPGVGPVTLGFGFAGDPSGRSRNRADLGRRSAVQNTTQTTPDTRTHNSSHPKHT